MVMKEERKDWCGLLLLWLLGGGDGCNGGDDYFDGVIDLFVVVVVVFDEVCS